MNTMIDYAEVQKRDPNFPMTPCQHCSKPVGYGDHEKYCSRNPENLARPCSRDRCKEPGNIVTDGGYTWICETHNAYENARLRMSHAEVNIQMAKIRIAEYIQGLQDAKEKLATSTNELETAKTAFAKLKFKMKLEGFPLS